MAPGDFWSAKGLSRLKALPRHGAVGPSLHGDFVDLSLPFHCIAVRCIDEPLDSCIRIDKHPTFHLIETIETLCLKLLDHGIKGAAHISIDFAPEKPA
jgi:hypothetical protein